MGLASVVPVNDRTKDGVRSLNCEWDLNTTIDADVTMMGHGERRMAVVSMEVVRREHRTSRNCSASECTRLEGKMM